MALPELKIVGQIMGKSVFEVGQPLTGSMKVIGYLSPMMLMMVMMVMMVMVMMMVMMMMMVMVMMMVMMVMVMVMMMVVMVMMATSCGAQSPS